MFWISFHDVRVTSDMKLLVIGLSAPGKATATKVLGSHVTPLFSKPGLASCYIKLILLPSIFFRYAIPAWTLTADLAHKRQPRSLPIANSAVSICLIRISECASTRKTFWLGRKALGKMTYCYHRLHGCCRVIRDHSHLREKALEVFSCTYHAPPLHCVSTPNTSPFLPRAFFPTRRWPMQTFHAWWGVLHCFKQTQQKVWQHWHLCNSPQ